MADETFQTGVILTEANRKVVMALAEKLSLGERGFSAALRIIIQEWAAARKSALPHAEETTGIWQPESEES